MPIMPPLRLHQSKALHRRRLAPPQSITTISQARHQHLHMPLQPDADAGAGADAALGQGSGLRQR